MPGNKNHHYVPQSYLKNFSVRGEQKQIGLYNHVSEKFVTDASIRHQASEDYLYGKEGDVESALGLLEGEGAKMINRMRETFVPPSVNTNAFQVFKRYLLTQMYRTKRAGREMEEGLNKAFQAMWRFEPDYREKYSGVRIKYEHPELVMLAWAQAHVPLLDHLEAKLLVNLSDLPFITSDNPVVTYNRMMQVKDNYMGATAIAVKGLQIFFPVFNRLMICLYDPQSYYYTGKDEFRIVTESVEEVHQLNALQYLTSEAQVFFDDTVSEAYIKGIVNEYKKVRNGKGPFSRTVVDFTENAPKYFLFNSSLDPTIDMQLSFIQLTKEAEEYQPEGIAPYRHQSFANVIEKINEELKDFFDEPGKV